MRGERGKGDRIVEMRARSLQEAKKEEDGAANEVNTTTTLHARLLTE